MTDDRWGNVFREMMMLVQSHVMEEEMQIFPVAKKSITKENSELLESRYLDEKEVELSKMM